MAIHYCPNCGNAVSEGLQSCPVCGQPLAPAPSSSNNNKLLWAIVFFLGLIIALVTVLFIVLYNSPKQSDGSAAPVKDTIVIMKTDTVQENKASATANTPKRNPGYRCYEGTWINDNGTKGRVRLEFTVRGNQLSLCMYSNLTMKTYTPQVGSMDYQGGMLVYRFYGYDYPMDIELYANESGSSLDGVGHDYKYDATGEVHLRLVRKG